MSNPAEFTASFTTDDGYYTASFTADKPFNANFKEFSVSYLSVIESATTAQWNAKKQLVGERNHIYVYLDGEQLADGTVVPKLKVGDGNAFLIDAPFVGAKVAEDLLAHLEDTDRHISQAERDFWNNKVRCYTHTKIDNGENLVFTIN